MIDDYYEILEVPRTATAAEIKKAYRGLVSKHHPDKNQGDLEAEEFLKKINGAYEVLGDPEKRNLYDLSFQKETVQTDQTRSASYEPRTRWYTGGADRVKYTRENYNPTASSNNNDRAKADATDRFSRAKADATDRFSRAKADATDRFSRAEADAIDKFKKSKSNEAGVIYTRELGEAGEIYNRELMEAREIYNRTLREAAETYDREIKEASETYNREVKETGNDYSGRSTRR